jgi:thiamine-phosphate pyrophosphorylase
MTPRQAYLRLYLVTDRDLSRGRPLADVVRKAVAGGVTAVQLREKEITARAFISEARAIAEVLSASDVPLFVNDRIDVALAVAADGVHVGQDDLPAADARRLIGTEMLLGVSVATEEEARRALAEGADYVSVSPVFLTPTKPDADTAVGLEGVARIRRAVADAPVLAIGGIDSSNARSVIAAGADGVSVVSAIVAADDPEAAALAIRAEVEAGLADRGGGR